MSTKYQNAAKRKLEIKQPPRKQDTTFDKTVRGKVGKVLDRREAPLYDIDELVQQVKTRGKTPWGGLAGFTRKNLRDVGMGQTTKKKIESVKPKPQLVEGVGSPRKTISKHARHRVRDF